ncbi:unnamed protein product, partial [Mesorhabditis belari]|uniref:Uncharacterized protein n=1 Tax=Mesorhabditis belari TaxID=2138241 RepID=A0AAF3JBC2_9BILA
MTLFFAFLLAFSATTAIAILPVCTKCPTGGIWSVWRDASRCSKTCGLHGEKTQKRNCTSAKFGCLCLGSTSRVVPCPVSLCGFGTASCASGYSKWLNKAAGKWLCGNVTRADDYKAPKCRITKFLGSTTTRKPATTQSSSTTTTTTQTTTTTPTTPTTPPVTGLP